MNDCKQTHQNSGSTDSSGLTIPKYTFLVDWYDPVAQIVKKFLMTFFSEDQTVELYDVKNRRVFLRRCKEEGIELDKLFKSAMITIMSRQIKIIDYADKATKNKFETELSQSFCMIKPDVVHKLGDIISFLRDKGFKVIKLKMGQMTEDCAAEFYKEHQGKSFLPSLITFMTSGPSVAMSVIGENAIKRWRDIIGPTDSEEAKRVAPNTLRAIYGTDYTRNGVHGSKDEEHVEMETEIWFPKFPTTRTDYILPTCIGKNSTCCIVKPHAVSDGTVGPIIQFINDRGFKVIAMEMLTLDVPIAEEFLEVYKGVVPEYSSMVVQLTSGPCVVMEVMDIKNPECSQATFRKICGPTDPEIARKLRPDTVRAHFGKDKVLNGVHCTDLPDDATIEYSQRMSDFLVTTLKEREKVEVFSAKSCEFLQFESAKVLKQPPVVMPLNSSEASYLSDNISSNSLNSSSALSNECNSFHGGTTTAIFTVHLPSFQILVVNSAACQIIKYSSDELCSMKLANLIIDSHKYKLSSLYEKFLMCEGEIPLYSEKLLELVTKDEEIILVSMCLKKLENPERCLVLVKAIDRKVGSIYIDQNDKILSCDENICSVFQYDTSEIVGLNIYTLLPTLKILEGEGQYKILRQQITGKTKHGNTFPVSLAITCRNPDSEEYRLLICVVTVLNGLILLNQKLHIVNCNSYFLKLLCGFSKNDVLDMPILSLIPTFCKDIGFEQSKKSYYQSSHLNDKNLSHLLRENESHHDSSRNFVVDECLNGLKSDSFASVNDSSKQYDCSSKSFEIDIKPLYIHMSANPKAENQDYQVLYIKNQISEGKHGCNNQINRKIENNSADKKDKSFDLTNLQNVMVQEGKFLGFAQHCDGNYISIKYQVKITNVNDETFYCVWLSNFSDLNKTFYPKVVSCLNSNSIDGSLERDSICSDQCTRPSTASLISQCDENLTAGDYSKSYTNIRQIGKGAFGYVKMAFRNSDGLLVVTKFTKKQNTNLVSWVFHSDLNMKIPLEISLLTTLHHPNIVKVLDVFHNDSFVQLVMEKHGAGFDLFEFINRGPKCDEKLKSYIYRQIISAVHYLNSLGILHRDIKDENVIINEKFEIKLIDFGSATFMPQNETFSKFYGTVEYCSPEVLQGCCYKGPELEIWALGVTLYVLTFGENPFYNVEETIMGQFSIPFSISEELDNLLHCMLNKNVDTRITIDKVVEHPWINQPVSIENYRFEEVVRCSKEEAYPPKYVHEINSEELLTKDSRTYSNNFEDTSNSNGSLYNLAEIDDFDDNVQEIQKCSLSELVGRKSNLSSIISSTPVKCKSDRLCKSATAVPNRFENTSSLSDRSYRCRESSFVEDGLFLINNYLRNLKADLHSENESDSFEENISVFSNIHE